MSGAHELLPSDQFGSSSYSLAEQYHHLLEISSDNLPQHLHFAEISDIQQIKWLLAFNEVIYKESL